MPWTTHRSSYPIVGSLPELKRNSLTKNDLWGPVLSGVDDLAVMFLLMRRTAKINQLDLDVPRFHPSLIWWTPLFLCRLILAVAVAEYIASLGPIGVTLGEHLLGKCYKKNSLLLAKGLYP